MSDYKHKENSGSLFLNGYKEKDSQPDYVGSANIEGKEFKIAGWKNSTKEGKTYLSVKYQNAEEQEQKIVDGTQPQKEGDLLF